MEPHGASHHNHHMVLYCASRSSSAVQHTPSQAFCISSSYNPSRSLLCPIILTCNAWNQMMLPMQHWPSQHCPHSHSFRTHVLTPVKQISKATCHTQGRDGSNTNSGKTIHCCRRKDAYREEEILQRGCSFKEIDSPLKVTFSEDVGEVQIHQIAKDRLEQFWVFRFNPNLQEAINQ